MRAGYITLARFFRDSDEAIPIRWYRALPNAPTLPFPSAINSLNWDDEPWTRTGPGEVWGAPRVFSGRFAPEKATGKHQCGTPADFRDGEHFDPLAPPTIYGDDGLPVCCDLDPERVALGGPAAGGSADVWVTDPADALGGLVAGGRADVWVTHPDDALGGIAAGGQAEEFTENLFCDGYTIDPPQFGVSSMVRSFPDVALWSPASPAFLSLVATSNGDGNGTWVLNVGGIGGTEYKPDGFWNGEGTRRFFVGGIPTNPFIDVTCAD